MKAEEFLLEKKIKYTPYGSGEFNETASLTMKPPTMEEYKEVTNLQQEVGKAFLSFTDKAKAGEGNDAGTSEETTNIPVEALNLMLFTNPDVPVVKLAELFKALAVKTIMLDEKTFIKEALFDQFSLDDFNQLMLTYISVFIMPSLLRQPMMKASGKK